MAKVKYIVFLAFCLASCKTASQFPLDDAYYRPEKTIPVIQKTPSAPSTPSALALPAIEYLNVQDTTVTIRIKK